MLRFGKISAIDSAKCLFQVTFDEDGLVSGWLPGAVKNSKENKSENFYDEGEHVAVLFDESLEYGVVFCAIYDSKNAPPVGNKDKQRTQYKDGSFIEYDRAEKKFTISCEGEIEVIKSTTTTIKASENVKIEADQVVEINGGTNGEVIKIDGLTSVLNSRFALFKTAIIAGFTAQSGVDSSAGVNAFNSAISSDTALNKNSYKNPNFKH